MKRKQLSEGEVGKGEMVNCTSDTIVNLMSTFDKILIQIVRISIWKETWDDQKLMDLLRSRHRSGFFLS